jgi:molybdate transport system substrate-binding protein
MLALSSLSRLSLRLVSAGLMLLSAFLVEAHAENAGAKTVTIFAAASLKNALDDAAKSQEQKTGDRVVISYAASSALAKQIEQGAPADVFISADLDWMDYVQKKNLIKTDTRFNLLGNRLVLIAPASSTTTLKIANGFPLAAALGTNHIAMANVKAVPAGKYGLAALEKLGVWKDVEPKVAQADNVRAALALVAQGEAPLGIVYETDAAAEPKVKIVDIFPDDTHPPIIYPIAITATAKNSDAAKAFVDYLKTPDAQAFFTKQGFTIVK